MNGHRYEHLQAEKVRFDPGQPNRFAVETHGDEFKIFLNDELVLTHHDNTYPTGGVGLRTVRTPVTFETLELAVLER